MQCPSCNCDLEQDDQVDTGSVDSACIIQNFKCTNEECKKHFEIEFSPINCNELDYVDEDE